MVKATKPGLDILQSCSVLASHWVKNVELESVIFVWASVFAPKFTHAKLDELCSNATAVFCNEVPIFYFFNFNLLHLKQRNNICFFDNV